MESDKWLSAWVKENRLLLYRPLVLWDLDSTLARTMQRRHMVPAIRDGNGTWEDYSMACLRDEPITDNVALMRMLPPSVYSHVAVSARSRCAEDRTWSWCRTHDIPLRGIILRPDGDPRSAAEWKTHVGLFLKQHGTVVMFVEDKALIALHLRQTLGVPVLCVDPCDPLYPDDEDARRHGL